MYSFWIKCANVNIVVYGNLMVECSLLAFCSYCSYVMQKWRVCVPFPFGGWGRMWNLTVSVPHRCLIIYFGFFLLAKRCRSNNASMALIQECMTSSLTKRVQILQSESAREEPQLLSKTYKWHKWKVEEYIKFYSCVAYELLIKMSRDMTKPTKWLCAQRRLRSAWASAQSDQSLRCPHEESLDT